MSSQGIVACFLEAIPCHWFVRSRSKIVIGIRLGVLAGMSANCMAQAGVKWEQWSEKFNTAGAKLVLNETGRTRSNGQTTVTYNIFASGLPLDARYVLWTRLVGSDPRPAADALLNDDGRVVSQLADPEHQIPEDPINLKVFAGRGEPKQFRLISSDGKFSAFTQIIPFPIEASDGSCHLSAIMTGANYLGVLISVAGLQPGEELLIDTRSDQEAGQTKGKATDRGTYDSNLFPFVKGKRSGKVQFSVTAKSCKVAVELPWGEGSYQLQ
jgi:hypothetical protein